MSIRTQEILETEINYHNAGPLHKKYSVRDPHERHVSAIATSELTFTYAFSVASPLTLPRTSLLSHDNTLTIITTTTATTTATHSIPSHLRRLLGSQPLPTTTGAHGDSAAKCCTTQRQRNALLGLGLIAEPRISSNCRRVSLCLARIIFSSYLCLHLNCSHVASTEWEGHELRRENENNVDNSAIKSLHPRFSTALTVSGSSRLWPQPRRHYCCSALKLLTVSIWVKDSYRI